MSDNLFVYGTLMLPDVQREIIGREVEVVPDTLTGFKTEPVVIDGNEYRTLVHDTAAEVDGAVMSIAKDELTRVDAYEPEEYKRMSVTTAGGRTAWVYVKS